MIHGQRCVRRGRRERAGGHIAAPEFASPARGWRRAIMMNDSNVYISHKQVAGVGPAFTESSPPRMLRDMRISLPLVSISVALLSACSNDSDESSATSTLEPGGSAGSPGSGADDSVPTGSGGGASGSGSEGVGDPPLDTSSDQGKAGRGSADAGIRPPRGADAGPPPTTSPGCPPGPFPADPLMGTAAAQQECTGLAFTEGAVWLADRNTLFFSDIVFNNPTSGRILSFTPGGACETFIENAGTNGLVIGLDGNLLGARHGDRTLTVFNLETLEPTVLVADNGGVPFNSPNDIAVRSDGNIYFTDPNYGLGGAMAAQPPRAYHRDPSGALTVIDEEGNSNGITLSPDESRLYLSHLGSPQGDNVLVFEIDEGGVPVNPQPFIADRGSDGMGIDCAGNLYITQQGMVQVFAPDATQVGTILAPNAANVAFGGPDRRTLFITAGTTLLSVELAIPGLPY
jgi:gluconolactonase